MEEVRLRALCLVANDYKEHDKLLTLLSFERGRITAKIRSASKPTSKLRLAAMPLCFGEYILSVSKTGHYVVTGCDVEESFYACWQDAHRYGASQIVLEVLEKISFAEVDTRRELYLGLQAISVVAYHKTTPLVGALWFLVNTYQEGGGDFFEVEASAKQKGLVEALLAATPEDLDALEIGSADLYILFQYYQSLLANQVGKKIGSIAKALQLFEA